ncbi:hypothetical protein IV102_18455 [bacterium]|nr:hypothetical protein [bacterium]
MALGPQLPEPTHQGERRLMDRAVFLGDWARTARPTETQSKDPKARFGQFLEREVDTGEETEGPGSDLPSSEAGSDTAVAQEVKDDQIENRQDADRQSRRGLEDEAEKASAGQWRGPHLSPTLAMLNLPQQLQAQHIEKQGKAQRQRDTSDSEALEDQVERVDDVLLNALRQSGLTQPVTGFSDPRLKPGPPQLGAPWSLQESAGGKVFRWESSPGTRQVLRWSDKESLLETTAAGQRQVIQKMGEQIWSQISPWEGDIGFDLPKNLRPF